MVPNGTRKDLMSLEDLRKRLDDLRRKRAGQPASLESLLYKATRCPRSHIHVPDPLMTLPDLEEVKLFLELDKTDELPFIKDKFDCDNSSLLLHSNAMLYSHSKGENWAFGNCESDLHSGHRFNIVSVKKGYVYFIEPQDDSFFTKTGKFKFIVL